MKDIENPFIRDLVFLLKEKKDESKKDAELGDLEMGMRLAYEDVLSLIYQQAIVFDINLDDIGLANYNPDMAVSG